MAHRCCKTASKTVASLSLLLYLTVTVRQYSATPDRSYSFIVEETAFRMAADSKPGTILGAVFTKGRRDELTLFAFGRIWTAPVFTCAVQSVRGGLSNWWPWNTSGDLPVLSSGYMLNLAGYKHRMLKCPLPDLRVQTDECVMVTLHTTENPAFAYTPAAQRVCHETTPRVTVPLYVLSVHTMVRNMAKRLDEWLAYHVLLGVEHFFLYDHLSTDDTAALLKPWILRGFVTLVLFPFADPNVYSRDYQTIAMNHCLNKYGHLTRWLGIFDVDQFFQIMKPSASITSILAAQLALNSSDAALQFEQHNFGEQYFIEQDRAYYGASVEGLVTEQFIWSAHQKKDPYKYAKLWILTTHVRVMQSVHELTWNTFSRVSPEIARFAHFLPRRWWESSVNPTSKADEHKTGARLQDMSMVAHSSKIRDFIAEIRK